MMQATSVTSPQVDAYLEKLEPDRGAALAQLRSLVLETVPDAVEGMKYRMPTYEYEGGVLCAFASHKHYMSLYLAPDLVEEHRAELSGLDVGKSCVRFRKLEEMPLDTVGVILEETIERRRGV
jgi:uncharacterized protein YdhG (YjbR/CyaY superfamily)